MKGVEVLFVRGNGELWREGCCDIGPEEGGGGSGSSYNVELLEAPAAY